MYEKIRYFKDNYLRPGYPDQRAITDFLECENTETVKSFQSILMSISNGSYNPKALESLLGKERVVRFGSYEEWARILLMWIAEASRR